MSPPSALPAELVTERLTLRPIAPEDLAFFTELHGSPEVVRYLGGDGTPRTPEATRLWLEKMLEWTRSSVAPYAIVRREDERLIGRCGLSVFELERVASRPDGVPLGYWGPGSSASGTEIEPIIEVGYVVHPEAWGRGYASEAAQRWVGHALDERGEPEISSMIHADNTPSIRVALKNGLERFGRIHFEGREYFRYRIDRERWRTRALSD